MVLSTGLIRVLYQVASTARHRCLISDRAMIAMEGWKEGGGGGRGGEGVTRDACRILCLLCSARRVFSVSEIVYDTEKS